MDNSELIERLRENDAEIALPILGEAATALAAADAREKALEKEVERLREALLQIVKEDERPGHPCDPPMNGYFGTIALAALEARDA